MATQGQYSHPDFTTGSPCCLLHLGRGRQHGENFFGELFGLDEKRPSATSREKGGHCLHYQGQVHDNDYSHLRPDTLKRIWLCERRLRGMRGIEGWEPDVDQVRVPMFESTTDARHHILELRAAIARRQRKIDTVMRQMESMQIDTWMSDDGSR